MLGDPGYIDILDGGDTGDAMAEDFDGLIFRPNLGCTSCILWLCSPRLAESLGDKIGQWLHAGGCLHMR